MKKKIFKEFENQYKKKFKDISLLDKFFEKYVLNAIKDTDLLKELNKNNRNINSLKPLDYLENEAILLRTIKVTVLLELSKDFDDFRKFDERIQKDKEYIPDIEFERIIKTLIKIPNE
ncbi:hypothetical protein [Chryseobacterium mucoviscidosis]|uniref:hypothetical protein n=1 Tax=Chryseobacterium mucoviscidosis TaxID=1945581 RepID=UPI0030189F7D